MYSQSLFFSILFSLTYGDAAVYPRVKEEPSVIGIVTDPALNRDSCGSCIIGSRALWVCRDTNPSTATLPIVSSTASWTDLPSGGGTSLNMYGENNWRAFYPLVPGQCDGEEGRDGNQAGGCFDGTRWPHWPDSPPLVVSDDGNVVKAYTWIPNHHLKANSFDRIVPDPSTSLYSVTYQHGTEGLPKAELVDSQFWQDGDFPYGLYGGLIRNNFAYLWGQNSTGGIALARVLVQDVTDKRKYEFFVGGRWTQSKPSVGDGATFIENVSAGGQGTYYWSEHWQSYVWIGQASNSIWAEFYITTAPQPEGPWIQPEHFYSGQNGNGSFPAYTIQAHPGLSDPSKNEIYLTYTKVDDLPQSYSTPLIHIEWENTSPEGVTGCSGKYPRDNGWCWRYCKGNSGNWCYTGKNCLGNEDVCASIGECAELSCQDAVEGCVEQC